MTPLPCTFDTADTVLGWAAIDDRVMGGVSRSRLRHDAAGHAVFEGTVSLERNGGFASVRSAAGTWGVAGARECVIEARGDGHQYKLCLFTDDGFDAISHQAAFTPEAHAWRQVHLPIAAFKASFRGRAVAGAAALDPGCIRQLGLMISGGQAGPFALALRSITLA